MHALQRARSFAALLLYALLFIFIAAPQLYLLLGWMALTRVAPDARRKRVDRWQMAWMDVAFVVVLRVAGVVVDFRLPDDEYYRSSKGPMLVIANHVGGFDGLLLTHLLRLSGRKNFRSIMKRQVASWPIIGAACKANACAFVERGGNPRDLNRVRWCGETALADGASVLIFPEGTVFNPSKVTSGFRRVLQPKSRGMVLLLGAMPGVPVLSVTICWHDLLYEDDLFDGILPPGTRVTVEARLVRDLGGLTTAAWLEAEWRRKDAMLAAKIENRP